MTITRNMKMADVIHLNYLLLPIINRFNINLGFGDKTVEEVCIENKVNIDFFVEIVNAFHDKNYFPKTHLKSFSIELIIDYLRKTHRFYRNEKVPEIAAWMDKLTAKCSSQPENVTLLKNFFAEYKTELESHTQKEEDIVYPYIEELKLALEAQQVSREFYDRMKSYSILNYENEHDDMEAKLYDLKNIIIKYLPPVKYNLCNKILVELFKLEADLNDHSRIEEKILVPKVVEMENQLKTGLENKSITLF